MNGTTSGRSAISISPAKVVATLALIVLCLLAAHLLAIYLRFQFDYDYAMGFIPRFYMNYEQSVPAYFSASLLMASALLFYFLHRSSGETPVRHHWLILSLVFLFLAVDEATGLHELLIQPVRTLLGTSGVFAYAWVIPYGIGVILLGLYLLPRIVRLHAFVRLLFFLSAAIYVSGALGMEMLAGHTGLDGHTRSLAFEILTTTEELMEMSGLILLIYAQLVLLRAGEKVLSIQVTS